MFDYNGKELTAEELLVFGTSAYCPGRTDIHILEVHIACHAGTSRSSALILHGLAEIEAVAPQGRYVAVPVSYPFA